MVALLLVVVSGPVDSVESTCFVLSVEPHFGSLEVYCALARWPNPTRKLVSSQVTIDSLLVYNTCDLPQPPAGRSELALERAALPSLISLAPINRRGAH